MLPMYLIGRLGRVLPNLWRLLMWQSALPNRRDVRVGPTNRRVSATSPCRGIRDDAESDAVSGVRRRPRVTGGHDEQWVTHLSDKARQAMDDATAADAPLMISAVTVVELVYLVEKGTFSQANVEAFYEILDATDSGFEVVPIDSPVARAVSRIPRTAVADPFDRMIAATALARAIPLSESGGS